MEKYFEEVQIPFLRSHQSFLVNYKYILGCGKTEVELINGIRIPISEDRLKKLEQQYGKLIREDIFDE